VRPPRTTWGRLALILPAFGAMIGLFIWRGPDWNLVADAFRFVAWQWVVAAIALNLLSVLARAGAWERVIESSPPSESVSSQMPCSRGESESWRGSRS